jgi:hypothetical protein
MVDATFERYGGAGADHAGPRWGLMGAEASGATRRALRAIAALAALSALCATGLGTGVAAAAWNQPQPSPLVVDATKFPESPQAATVAGTPYLAWVEVNRAYLPTVGLVRLVRLQGGVWTAAGGPLNIDQTHVAEFVAIASVGGAPYVAWTEKNGSGVYQLYVSRFDGSSWAQVGGGSLNVNASQSVGQVGITDVGGVPYVAFAEAGAVYVESYNAGTNIWSEAGGGQVAAGDVPSVATVAGSLYVAFLGGSYPQNVFVYSLSAGNTWVPVGGSLNVATNRNSENPAIADVGGAPEVAFAEEANSGQNDYEVHVDAFLGGMWTPEGGVLTLRSGDVSLDPAIVGVGSVPFVAFDEHPNGTGGGGVMVSHFVGGAWAQVGGPLVGDTTDMATPSFPTITAVGPVPYAAWSEDKIRAARLEPDLLAETATPTATGATLRVQVNDDGVPLPVGFEFGTTPAFGTRTPLQTTAGTGMNTVSQTIAGLAPHTLYDWRAFGSDTVRATSLGSLATFTTLAAAAGVATITGLTISPSAFVAANAGGPVVAARATKPGAIITYRDSQAATTTFSVQRPMAGRRVGRSCVKPTKGNAKHKPCTRYITVGSFRHVDVPGTNRFRFTGRLGHHVLKPGHYRLRAIARDAAGAGPPAFRRFRVKG